VFKVYFTFNFSIIIQPIHSFKSVKKELLNITASLSTSSLMALKYCLQCYGLVVIADTELAIARIRNSITGEA